MKWLTRGLQIYAGANLLYFAFRAAVIELPPPGIGNPLSIRMFSAFWMAFHSISMSIFYSSAEMSRARP